MVYFIRAKSYFKYAQDLFSSLKESQQRLPEEAFQKKAQEVVFTALKALWALSQITPPEKSPDFEEVVENALKGLSQENKQFVKKLISQIKSNTKKEVIISFIEKLLNLIQEELKPIL